jgi:hypothetical protein
MSEVRNDVAICPLCHDDSGIAHEHGVCEQCGNVFLWDPDRAERQFRETWANDLVALADKRVEVCTSCNEGFLRWQRAPAHEKESVHREEMAALEQRRLANRFNRQSISNAARPIDDDAADNSVSVRRVTFQRARYFLVDDNLLIPPELCDANGKPIMPAILADTLLAMRVLAIDGENVVRCGEVIGSVREIRPLIAGLFS